MPKLTIPRKLFLLLSLLSLAFIWGQSLLPRSASSKESKWVTQKVVQPTVNAVTVKPSSSPASPASPAASGNPVPSGTKQTALTSKKTSVTDVQVRDLAHSVEYFVFAFFVSLAVANPRKPHVPLSLCFSAAFLDESLQILSSRGPQIQDVWLDLFGIIPAILLATLCLRLSRALPARLESK